MLSREGKDQTGGVKEQSACRRAVLQRSTTSHDDPKQDYDEGKRKIGMNYTEGRITELIGDPD